MEVTKWLKPSVERVTNYTNLHGSEPMGPFASPDGHDFPRLIDELVPGLAAQVDDIVV